MTFFGLTQVDRINIFSEIHEIVFHGNGGYDWETIYNMPLWLRKFTFNKIKKWYQDQEEAADARNNIVNSETASKIKPLQPNVEPTYSTKAAKK